MTRGKMFLITDTKILQSCEFNGGCYLEDEGAVGPTIINGLHNINTEEEFKDFLIYFNQENYGYTHELCYDITEEVAQDEEFWNMKKAYYDKFFSDYIYIKNASNEEVVIETENYYLYLEKGNVAVVYFGVYTNTCEDYSDNIKKEEANKKTIEKIIKKIKELGWSVTEDGDTIEIEDWMRAGEDMLFYCSRDSIIEDIKKFSDIYDPDEHARENIKGGDPRSVQFILDDAKEFANKLDDLCDALEELE